MAAENRTYVDASDVRGQLAAAPDRLMAYAQDDAVETLAVSRILSPPYFAQAQVAPFDYQSTYLRWWLQFCGIRDVHEFRLQPTYPTADFDARLREVLTRARELAAHLR